MFLLFLCFFHTERQQSISFQDSKFFIFYKGEGLKLRSRLADIPLIPPYKSFAIVSLTPYNAFIGLHFVQFNFTRLKIYFKRSWPRCLSLSLQGKFFISFLAHNAFLSLHSALPLHSLKCLCGGNPLSFSSFSLIFSTRFFIASCVAFLYSLYSLTLIFSVAFSY